MFSSILYVYDPFESRDLSIDFCWLHIYNFMEKRIVELPRKTLLVDVSDYPLNFLIFPHRLTANAYVGCLHDCTYCLARWYCKRDEVRVKTNAPEILKKELQRRIAKAKPREPICLGSISDPYQSVESEYQLTRKMIEVCDELSYPVFIVTKSDLVVRDSDALSSLAKRNLVAVNQLHEAEHELPEAKNYWGQTLIEFSSSTCNRLVDSFETSRTMANATMLIAPSTNPKAW